MQPKGSQRELSQRQHQEARHLSYEAVKAIVVYLEAELEATKRRLWDLEQQVWGRR